MLLFLYLFIFCIVFRADKWYGKYGILPAVAVPTDTGVNTGVGCGGCDAWHVYIYEDINININGARKAREKCCVLLWKFSRPPL